MKDQYRGYELHSSDHGVDIFKDGAWVDTIMRTSASTGTSGEEAWINRGKKFVDENLAEAGQRVNEQRVARAAATLQAYRDFEGDDPDESHFRDLLTDLHHLLHDRNPALTASEVQAQFMREVTSAAGHFEEETVVVTTKEKSRPAPEWAPDRSISGFESPEREPDPTISNFDTHHLTDEQQKVARAILSAAQAKDAGGCRAFYSPDEWRRRGEEFGCESALVVVHDGGDLAPAFNYAYDDDRAIEAVSEALKRIGYWAEACTCWYTAIYPKEYA